MPLPPIPAGATFFAMPGTVILNNLIPAKRIPIYLPAFRTTVFTQQIRIDRESAAIHDLILGLDKPDGI